MRIIFTEQLTINRARQKLKQDRKASAKQMNTTVKEAKADQIFVIENESVVETNLYDFVMKSAEETTSPRGVEMKLHVREKFEDVYNDDNEFEGQNQYFEVWDWGFRGNFPNFVERFETEKEAEDFIFQRTYQFDFSDDDQRDTCYYYSFEEAKEEMIRIYAERNYIDMPVAESIFKHKECIDKIKALRKEKAIEASKIDKERVEKIAYIYSRMITKIEGESYKETARRLSDAIGQKIESSVFHRAVKLIREK